MEYICTKQEKEILFERFLESFSKQKFKKRNKNLTCIVILKILLKSL